LPHAARQTPGQPSPRRLTAVTARLLERLSSSRPERVYLALALLFGFAFLLLTPPFQIPDEEAHLRRSYEISEGHIVAQKKDDHTGDDLPRGLEAFYARFKALQLHGEEKVTLAALRDAANVRYNADEREFVAFSNSAIHPPIPYLPQAAGVLLARCLSSSVLASLYAGRLMNILAATGLTWLAIQLAPAGKWAFATLALTPRALSLSASLSPDALTNALSFLLIAFILSRALRADQSISVRSVAVMALLAAAVGLAKQAYFLLPLCFLMIPLRNPGDRIRYWIGFAVVMGATFLAVVAWALVVRDIYSPADPRFGMNPREQFRLMCSDPVEFLFVLFRTLQFVPLYWEEYLGYLGLVDLRLGVGVSVGEFALLIVVCARGFGPDSGITRRQALLAGGVALLVALTVLVVVHITWDRVGSSDISVQGRYFIPIGPLVGILLGQLGELLPFAIRHATRLAPAAAILCVPIFLSLSLVRVHDRYFVDSKEAAVQRCRYRGDAFLAVGARAEAREQFEQALRYDPDDLYAHFWLGVLLEQTRPREAADHFRAVLKRAPDNFLSLCNLGSILVRQGEYPEAIGVFRRALQIDPQDANVQTQLVKAMRWQEILEGGLPKISPALLKLANPGLLEKRYAGTEKEGMYLKPNRGRITDTQNQPPFPSLDFCWRIPPPSGREIRVLGADGSVVREGRRRPFYACSVGLLATKRVFVFPPPASAMLLSDPEVSWFFQLPLADLTEEERQQEDAYRGKHGLAFPLTALPD
jgi:uncharacterized membrane protein